MQEPYDVKQSNIILIILNSTNQQEEDNLIVNNLKLFNINYILTGITVFMNDIFEIPVTRKIKVLKALQNVLLFAIAEFNIIAATNNTERKLIKH